MSGQSAPAAFPTGAGWPRVLVRCPAAGLAVTTRAGLLYGVPLDQPLPAQAVRVDAYGRRPDGHRWSPEAVSELLHAEWLLETGLDVTPPAAVQLVTDDPLVRAGVARALRVVGAARVEVASVEELQLMRIGSCWLRLIGPDVSLESWSAWSASRVGLLDSPGLEVTPARTAAILAALDRRSLSWRCQLGHPAQEARLRRIVRWARRPPILTYQDGQWVCPYCRRRDGLELCDLRLEMAPLTDRPDGLDDPDTVVGQRQRHRHGLWAWQQLGRVLALPAAGPGAAPTRHHRLELRMSITVDGEGDPVTGPAELDLDAVVRLVEAAGVPAFVGQDGSAITAVYAGQPHRDESGDQRWPTCAGPGWFLPDPATGRHWGFSRASLDDFPVHPDDDGASPGVDALQAGITTEWQAAAVIIAQTRLDRAITADEARAAIAQATR